MLLRVLSQEYQEQIRGCVSHDWAIGAGAIWQRKIDVVPGEQQVRLANPEAQSLLLI